MHPSTRLALPLAALAVALSGCSAAGGGLLPSLPGGMGGPAVERREGPAPTRTNGAGSLRVDEVRRAGRFVTVSMTAGRVADQRLTHYSFEVDTDSGITLAPERFEQRDLPAGSQTQFAFTVHLPDEPVGELSLSPGWQDMRVTFPIPEDDATWQWAPAPLRQAGLDAALYRDGDSEVQLLSIRSYGMITEVDYRALSTDGSLDLCQGSSNDRCALTEPNGTVHHALPGGPRVPADNRVQGTLRFIGELSPDTTEVTADLLVDYKQTGPLRIPLPAHDDSPVRAAAGSLQRTPTPMQPVELADPRSSLRVRIDDVQVLADRSQVHITATGTDTPVALETARFGRATLVESNGYVHTLAVPDGGTITVPANGTLDATLVFPGAVPADVTSFVLTLGGKEYDAPLTATLTLPAGSPAAPRDGATLGQVKATQTPTVATPKAPAPTASDPSASPAPSPVSLDRVTIGELPRSTFTAFGPVKSSIAGVGVGSTVASGSTVDANADAKAQRTLQDLGAERTPDGWVLTLPETVLFDYNKTDIKPDAAAKLDSVAELLTYFDQAKIAVQGHTDSTGDAQSNQQLSVRRAEAVTGALGNRGVPASRITVEGFGAERPIASNDTDEGKVKNRRVEIVLNDEA